MTRSRRLRTWSWLRVAQGAAAVIIVGLFWINFAPPRMGGDSIYVVTSGISMEPLFHTGDLAVLRPASSYHVGEIVGYKAPVIGIVLHRIIGEVDGHFLMKGDNNNFVDTYHPTPSDVVGRLWLHVPKIGRLINTQRNREASVGVGALAMMGVMGVPIERKRRRRRKDLRRSDDSTGATSGPRMSPPRSNGGGVVTGVLGLPGQVVASVALVVVLAALALGAISFTRSTMAVTSDHLAYQQVGGWTYSAPAKGNVYANGAVTTGQPIFLTVAPLVKFGFDYKFNSLQPVNLRGRAGLTAVLSSSDGWTHTIALGPTKTFLGTGVIVTGVFNLSSIENYLANVQAQIGQTSGTVVTYTLTVQPNVNVTGVLAGSTLQSVSFNPPLTFSLLSNQAQLTYSQPGSSITLAQALHPNVPGAVIVSHNTAATLSFFGLHPSVTASRRLALWALLASVLTLTILGFLLSKARQFAETARIAARYGALLVAVQRPDALGSVGTTRVATLEDLVKIAQFQGRLILHCESEVGRDYFVRDQTTTYLYSVPDSGAGVPAVLGDAPAASLIGAAHDVESSTKDGE